MVSVRGGDLHNEIDQQAAAWLRELITAGALPPGTVDERSIAELEPDDVRGHRHVHFFAGIGGWAHALDLAGWPREWPIWTGSCPCQPFSAAGKRRGTEDERHLWPEFRRLIAGCLPPVVVGEQVASAAGREWLAAVRFDLEELGYEVGAADICAAGVGAPHIRQRLWFGAVRVADGDDQRLERRCAMRRSTGERAAGACRLAGGVADGDAGGCGIEREAHDHDGGDALGHDADRRRTNCGVAYSDGGIAGQAGAVQPGGEQRQQSANGAAVRLDDGRRPGAVHGGWSDVDWLFCRDGRWRPVEPGTFPLADGLPARVGRLRGYGNAIVPQVAAAFVQEVMQWIEATTSGRG